MTFKVYLRGPDEISHPPYMMPFITPDLSEKLEEQSICYEVKAERVPSIASDGLVSGWKVRWYIAVEDANSAIIVKMILSK